ncbi:MAG TPA: response regulator transcription factor [Arachidicoccus soli]|uniref:DNA-binding response regulator n=1 Tax=Arachidicoccus soli TaxID=2341117 RepID=A0A386HNC9_9BACT|nr:response regulator transcription factor [Arachidicoccus soli]AYD46981.1 DNA-binding response regulator [Arachidicoccus soli]HEU0228900.1 response regulator transcription factor [Arachidicoccus soli]
MQAIAIDDEPLALQVIQQYAHRIDWLQIEAVFTDALEAKEYLKENSVDLIFLDIQMPEINGMQFFKNLEVKPEVVFTTAYSQYAVEGFNLNAVDYLVKPFEYERFLQASEKVRELIGFRQIKEIDEGFLLVKYNYQWQKIAYKNIDYIEALDDYIKINVFPRPFLIHMSMKVVAEKLPAEKFIRVHRSYIVSLEKVTGWNKNTISIKEKIIPISYTYQKQVQEILKTLMDESI